MNLGERIQRILNQEPFSNLSEDDKMIAAGRLAFEMNDLDSGIKLEAGIYETRDVSRDFLWILDESLFGAYIWLKKIPNAAIGDKYEVIIRKK